MSPVQALVRNVGTWPLMPREMTSGKSPRGRIPKQRFRGGATCSSDEAAVMAVDRRGGIIRSLVLVNRVIGRN